MHAHLATHTHSTLLLPASIYTRTHSAHLCSRRFDLNQHINGLQIEGEKVIADGTANDDVNAINVDVLSVSEALQRYAPQIILQSWMPSNVDYSKQFRDCPSVQVSMRLVCWYACTFVWACECV